MKGMVFTEFLEWVDGRFSFEATELLIEMSELPSGGVYTAVGTYDAQEMMTLVGNLSGTVGVPVSDLLRQFGRHLFKRFPSSFPAFFEGVSSTLEFLPRVNDYVHVEVRKLYPDAELPSFLCGTPDPGTLVMIYRSERNLADLAEGLILGCIDYFGESFVVRREDHPAGPTVRRFVIAPK